MLCLYLERLCNAKCHVSLLYVNSLNRNLPIRRRTQFTVACVYVKHKNSIKMHWTSPCRGFRFNLNAFTLIKSQQYNIDRKSHFKEATRFTYMVNTSSTIEHEHSNVEQCKHGLRIHNINSFVIYIILSKRFVVHIHIWNIYVRYKLYTTLNSEA